MSKTITLTIDECVQCPHQWTDKGRNSEDGSWSERCCAKSKLGRKVEILRPIPAWCPLEDAATKEGGAG